MSNFTTTKQVEIAKSLMENYKTTLFKFYDDNFPDPDNYAPYPVPEGLENRGKIIQNVLDSNENVNTIADLNYLMYLFNDIYADENDQGFNSSWRFKNLYFQYYKDILTVEIKFDKAHKGIIRNGYTLIKDTLDKILIRDIARLVISNMVYTLPTNLDKYNLRLNHYDTLIPKEGYIKLLERFLN